MFSMNPAGVWRVANSAGGIGDNACMRVLLVEDDPAVAAGIVQGLKGNGFEVIHVATGSEAVARHTGDTNIDMVLLDLGLPDLDGQEVCARIRAVSAVPIIIVSARDDEIDKVISLELGADDYLAKPFGTRELLARIRAVARRAQPNPHGRARDSRQIGDLIIDRRSRRVLFAGTELHLTAKEFDLLSYLAEDPGAVCTRTELINNVWDVNWFGTTKTLDAHVAALRKKLGSPAWVEAVRGVGFRLGAPESVHRSGAQLAGSTARREDPHRP